MKANSDLTKLIEQGGPYDQGGGGPYQTDCQSVSWYQIEEACRNGTIQDIKVTHDVAPVKGLSLIDCDNIAASFCVLCNEMV